MCVLDSGTGPPQACLNAMLHSNCRGAGCMFYKVAGKVGMYGLMVSLRGSSVHYEDVPKSTRLGLMSIEEKEPRDFSRTFQQKCLD